MKKPDKCIHFTGTQHATCEAGVNYNDVRKDSEDGKTRSIPCLLKYNHCGATCEKFELPTAEQVAADEAEAQKRFDATMTARKAIVAYLGGAWKKGMNSARGIIDCPVCGKAQSLHFSRAGYNGHVHASCETKGCVSWME
jgi:hypothetical protein